MRDAKPTFSRRSLNVLIFITAALILVFSQMGPGEESKQSSEVDIANPDTQEGPLTMARFFPELADIPEIPEVELDLDIQQWTTPQGMDVYFVESPKLPMVDVRLVFSAGSARDPEGKAGLAAATANLLNLGAVGMGATEVAREFEFLGAQMSTGSYRDMAIGSLRVLRDPQYFDPSLDLFSRVMSEIEFTEADFERELGRQKIAISHKVQSPRSLLGDAVYDVLYGEEHHYGRPTLGTLKSVESIRAADIVGYHSQFYSAKNATLAVVGALTRAEVESLAQVLAARMGQSEAPKAIPKGPKAAQEQQRHVTFDGDQTHIALVKPGVYRGHEDYYALFLTNHILGGGGFASLLNKKIRQERAYAYSVGSNYTAMAGTGPVSIQMQTRSDQAAAAIEATRQVVADLVENGPSEQVLADAKQQILSEFAMRTASNSSQLAYIGSIGFYGLPLDYLKTFNSHIEGITADDVKRMAKLYFTDMAVVTVGSEDPL